MKEANSPYLNEQPNIVVTIPDSINDKNLHSPIKNSHNKLDFEEAQVIKLLQEYDNFGLNSEKKPGIYKGVFLNYRCYYF